MRTWWQRYHLIKFRMRIQYTKKDWRKERKNVEFKNSINQSLLILITSPWFFYRFFMNKWKSKQASERTNEQVSEWCTTCEVLYSKFYDMLFSPSGSHIYRVASSVYIKDYFKSQMHSHVKTSMFFQILGITAWMPEILSKLTNMYAFKVKSYPKMSKSIPCHNNINWWSQSID